MEDKDKIVTPRDYTLQELRLELRRRTRRVAMVAGMAGFALGLLVGWLL